MALRKKTPAKKTKAKKTTKRVRATKPKRRETPMQKLAFRVEILEELCDALDKDIRELIREHAAPDAIDVTPEPSRESNNP
jgi:hypothetical protein